MKKILMFAAIFAAVVVQAATVSWSIDKSMSGKTYRVFAGDISSTITSWQNASLVLADITTSVQSTDVTGSVKSRGISGTLEGVTDYVTFVCYDTIDDGKAFSYTVMSASGYTYEPPATKPDDLVTSTWSSGTFKAAAVPEPTTVALLALGLAAVGLKRKLA